MENSECTDAGIKDFDKIKDMDLEQSLCLLEAITQAMKQPDVSLEKTFEYYKAGIEAVEHASSIIEKIEAKITQVNGMSEEDG